MDLTTHRARLLEDRPKVGVKTHNSKDALFIERQDRDTVHGHLLKDLVARGLSPHALGNHESLGLGRTNIEREAIPLGMTIQNQRNLNTADAALDAWSTT